MLMDLFESNAGQLLPVADAELVLWQRVDFGNEDDLLRHLIEETPWRQEQVTVWGKTYDQPRLIAWYGDNAQSYFYSGITLTQAMDTRLVTNKGQGRSALREFF